MSEDKALIQAKEAGVDKVINHFFQNKTPKEVIKKRPGPGGQIFEYVPIGYVISQLNNAFGFSWEWKVIESHVETTEVWLRGELTIKDFPSDKSVTRSGVGGAKIKKLRGTNEAVS